MKDLRNCICLSQSTLFRGMGPEFGPGLRIEGVIGFGAGVETGAEARLGAGAEVGLDEVVFDLACLHEYQTIVPIESGHVARTNALEKLSETMGHSVSTGMKYLDFSVNNLPLQLGPVQLDRLQDV